MSNFKSAPGIGDSFPLYPPEYKDDVPKFWCDVCSTRLFDDEIKKEGRDEKTCKLCGNPVIDF